MRTRSLTCLLSFVLAALAASATACFGSVDSTPGGADPLVSKEGVHEPTTPVADADAKDVWLAFDLIGGGDSEIWVVRADGTQRKKIELGRSGASPAFSPNGRDLAFASVDGIWIKDLATGQSRQLTRDRMDGVPAWSPDGRRLVFRRDVSIAIIDSDGSNEHITTQGPPPGQAWFVNYGHPTFSGDGQSLMFGGGGGIDATTTDGANLQTLFATAGVAMVAVSPDGQSLAIASDCGLRTIPLARADKACDDGTFVAPIRPVARPAWGTNGLLAFTADMRRVQVIDTNAPVLPESERVDGGAGSPTTIVESTEGFGGKYMYEVAWSKPGTVIP